MAVKLNFKTKFGVDGEYVNFDPQFVGKTKVNFRMKFWKDEATRNTEGSLPFNDQMAGSSKDRIVGFDCLYSFDLDLDSPLNPYQQGYAYLHTLDEFADAKDEITDEQSVQLEAIKSINITTLKKAIQ